MTNNRMNTLFFENYFEEGHDRFYKRVDQPLTEAHEVAFHLGKLNYQVGNGGFGQWVDNGYYEHTGGELSSALKKGLDAGIEGLRPVYDLLLKAEKSMNGKVDCEDCNGSGCTEEYDEEDHLISESCDNCYGNGEFDCDRYHFDVDTLEKLDSPYYNLDEEELFDAYGQLVILFIPEEERNILLKKYKLQTMFS